MAIDIEQFTAPGKYYIDLNMEQTEELLKSEIESSYKEKPRIPKINKTN